MDCGYSLEPPRRGGSNESRNKKNNVYPYKPQFYYTKVGFKGVNTIWACFRDVKYTENCSTKNDNFLLVRGRNIFQLCFILKPAPLVCKLD